MHFLGVDVEMGGGEGGGWIRKKKNSSHCLFPFNLAYACHLNCSIEVVFQEIHSHLFYYYCYFRWSCFLYFPSSFWFLLMRDLEVVHGLEEWHTTSRVYYPQLKKWRVKVNGFLWRIFFHAIPRVLIHSVTVMTALNSMKRNLTSLAK